MIQVILVFKKQPN